MRHSRQVSALVCPVAKDMLQIRSCSWGRCERMPTWRRDENSGEGFQVMSTLGVAKCQHPWSTMLIGALCWREWRRWEESLPECDAQHAWLNCMERGSIHCDTLPEGEFSSSFESCVWPCIVCTIKCILSHKHLHLIFSVCLPMIGAF